jgi:electron transfer flavoprotein beta subunit
MSQHKKLEILVLLREAIDPNPPVHTLNRGAGISERGVRRMANPGDLAALEQALCLKDRMAAGVTVLAISPSEPDVLRLALAMGADRGIRFRDQALSGGDAVTEARVLARIARVLAPDLVFTGNRMLDRGDDPVPALAASSAGLPCIQAALSLTLCESGVEVLRKADRGARELVAAPFPCTVLFDSGVSPRYPSVTALAQSLALPILDWGLADVGLCAREVGAAGCYLPLAQYAAPRPDPVRTVTPDPRLPAFERILSLLSGGVTARDGKRHALSGNETAERIWQILADEGVRPREVP